jgi:hypothetical protein
LISWLIEIVTVPRFLTFQTHTHTRTHSSRGDQRDFHNGVCRWKVRRKLIKCTGERWSQHAENVIKPAKKKWKCQHTVGEKMTAAKKKWQYRYRHSAKKKTINHREKKWQYPVSSAVTRNFRLIE